jgi:hypothetical protein
MILLFGEILERRLVGVSIVERIESFKAGILAAVSFGLAYIVATLVNSFILGVRFERLAQLQAAIGVDLLVKVAIALLSGFLFGVTYRYIIRGDRNSHLKDGAVLAFGLVRGFAPLEVSENLGQNILNLSILGSESVFCFAIARFSLDLALYRAWIKPFS